MPDNARECAVARPRPRDDDEHQPAPRDARRRACGRDRYRAGDLDALCPGSARYWRDTLWEDDGTIRDLGVAKAIALGVKFESTGVTFAHASPVSERKPLQLVATVGKVTIKPEAQSTILLTLRVQAELDKAADQLTWLHGRYMAGAVFAGCVEAEQADIEDAPPPPSNGADGEGHQAFPGALDGTWLSAAERHGPKPR